MEAQPPVRAVVAVVLWVGDAVVGGPRDSRGEGTVGGVSTETRLGGPIFCLFRLKKVFSGTLTRFLHHSMSSAML